jgi:hypothetical protein
MEPVNLILIGIIFVLAVIIAVLLIGRGRSLDRENELTGRINAANDKSRRAIADKDYAEGKLAEEHSKLEKIHLLKFSSWLFADGEFVQVISAKVDELRPDALDRYNAKQKEEMRLETERWAADTKKFQESVELNRKREKAKLVGGFTGIDGTAAIVTMSTMASMDTSTSFTDGGSCSVDSSCM